jgi:hypothetical protein
LSHHYNQGRGQSCRRDRSRLHAVDGEPAHSPHYDIHSYVVPGSLVSGVLITSQASRLHDVAPVAALSEPSRA